MTQVDLFEVRVPKEGTQCWTLLKAFQRGERLTVGEAFERYEVYALSQRVGELKRKGWPVRSESYRTAGGAVVARYWMGT